MGELEKTPLPKSQVKKTGTRTRWLPDLDVFTDIAIPAEYFTDVLRRQAVVNEGIAFKFRNQQEDGKFDEQDFVYEHGIQDYVAELAASSKTLNIPPETQWMPAKAYFRNLQGSIFP